MFQKLVQAEARAAEDENLVRARRSCGDRYSLEAKLERIESEQRAQGVAHP